MSKADFLKIFIIFFVEIHFAMPLCAQSFNLHSSGQVKGQDLGFSSWCDINRDGFLDIFITGVNLVNGVQDFTHSMIYINDGHGNFSESNIKNIPRLIYGSNDWGDFNNDGWPDLLLAGTTSGYTADGGTKIYINKQGTALELAPISLPRAAAGKVIWADFNNDGWQDIFVMGLTNTNDFSIKLYWNEQGLNVEDSQTPFAVKTGGTLNLQRCSAIAEDFDSDGDIDLVVGQSTKGGFSVDLYENVDGKLALKSTTLPQLNYATFASADFNGDGFYDLVVNGILENETSTTSSPAHFVVLKGNSYLNFSVIKRFDGFGSYWGSVCSGDLNNDGLPDILINGTGNGAARNTVFINQGGIDFTLAAAGFAGTLLGDANLGDMDNDGDLDVIITGSLNGSASSAQARIYKNTNIKTNTRPTMPQNLVINTTGNNILLSWDRSIDSETPQESLSYNIRIGTSQNMDSVISGLSLSDGKRLVEKPGNTSLNASKEVILPNGIYYWQVQALDAAQYESEFSSLQSFCVTNSPEIIQEPHYCYGELLKVEVLGTNIKWYGDEDLKTVLHTGNVYETIGRQDQVFYVTQEVNGCISSPIVVRLNIGEQPVIDFFIEEALVEVPEVSFKQCSSANEIIIEARSNFTNIKWLESPDSFVTARGSGTYTTVVSNELGCSTTRSLNVIVHTLESVFIPNVITPNNDFKNDFFVPSGFENFDISFSLFNRYGDEIFYSNPYNNTFNGNNLVHGNYFYQISVKECPQTWKGWLSILK